MQKVMISILFMAGIISACKKSENNVKDILTSHYIFKPGTYWVYDGSRYVDSQYVVANGVRNGMPYMQINDVVKDVNVDTLCSTKTIYIGIGPNPNQLQMWGLDLINHTDAQVIFQSDTPAIGTLVAQGCIFSSLSSMGGIAPTGVPGTPISYVIEYQLSNKNQEYGDILYYFYPDFGIVQKQARSTPWGNIYWNLSNHHLIQ